MKLEDQVCSLELAKKLKELGVRQESAFYWQIIKKGICFAGSKPSEKDVVTLERCHEYNEDEFVEYVSAFTVAELGELMKGQGMGVTAYSNLIVNEWWIRGGNWIVEKQQYDHLETDSKWADALAKMLIHLIENGIVKAEGRASL